MSEKTFLNKMVESVEGVPTTAEVLVARQYSVDEIEQRVKRFLYTAAEAYRWPLDRGDWVVQQGRTLVRLPLGSRAIFYHASGFMKLVTGLGPMESLFRKVEARRVG